MPGTGSFNRIIKLTEVIIKANRFFYIDSSIFARKIIYGFPGY
jgi:hypothetical protein